MMSPKQGDAQVVGQGLTLASIVRCGPE
jgi:hypothetical protein